MPETICGAIRKRPAAASVLAAALSLFALAGCATNSPGRLLGTRQLDDSYTVSQRYDANRGEHPEFALPIVELGDGRTILFDRRYKLIGTRELHADIFLPTRGEASGQALVLVHGGAWRSGNKSNFYAIASLLAKRGYAVILPEYRLAPEARYPAGLIDINDAIDWTKARAADFGIDPQRIAIGGESSGGQMAALIAYTGGLPLFSGNGAPAPRVNALIDIDGVLDFTSPLALQYENAAGEDSMAALWLGGSMESAPEKWKEASAANYLGSNSPPTLIISGEADRFTAGRNKVVATLTAEGTPVRHVHFAGLPHTFWLFAPYVGQVADTVDSFLRNDLPPTARH